MASPYTKFEVPSLSLSVVWKLEVQGARAPMPHSCRRQCVGEIRTYLSVPIKSRSYATADGPRDAMCQ